MAGDDYRRASLEIWEEMAAGWEGHRRSVWDASHAVGEWLVDALDPQPGETVLELAGGVGDTGFAAARRLGAEGRLITTDFSEAMVDAARRRAQELGVSNAEFRSLDAQRMDLDDRSVDGVLCRWGYMLMAEPAAALSETQRVLSDGGRGGALGLGRPAAEPLGLDPGTGADRASRRRATGPPRARNLRHGERGTHTRAAIRRGSNRRGSRRSKWPGDSTPWPSTGTT